MIRTLIIVTFILLTGSCQNHVKNKNADSDSTIATQSQPQDVPYTVAKNYFVKNTVQQNGLQNFKIETKENFDSIFGVATTMNVKPIDIDFSKQYVIALLGNTTDTATEFSPSNLQKDSADQITLSYRVNKGAKQSFKIRPVLILIVDKANNGTVFLKEQQH